MSSVFLKLVMGASGLVWFGFLLGHLGSNLHIFGGAASLNEYYAGLKSNALIFWGVRVVLLGSVVAHVLAAFELARRNRAARPVRYQITHRRTATLNGLTMVWTGPILALFILYHLAQLTWGVAMPAGKAFVEGDEYRNIIGSLSVGYVALFYLVGFGALAFHLMHGAKSALFSLGLREPWAGLLQRLLSLLALFVVLGMLAILAAVYGGALI